MNSYALILAGGSGTRFWPLSRDARPKQLLDLFGDGTLLEHAIRRLDGLIPTENILILTNEKQEQAVRETAHFLPKENIFAEPAKRDTAPAVALGAGLVAARDPNAVMMVLPADQLIKDTDSYRSVMKAAIDLAANSSGLVTIGIKPTWPCPSYGYIERGESIDIAGHSPKHTAARVRRFREKPDSETAQKYLDQGSFCWNAGMFVWSIPTLQKELAIHTPELAEFITQLQNAKDIRSVVEEKFPKLTPISIDYALMEKAELVYNIEANFDWDDVGSWISLAKYLDATEAKNRANRPISEIDAADNIVYNTRPESHVALLGVENLIIVQTEDGLLIANRDHADEIKKLMPLLPENLR